MKGSPTYRILPDIDNRQLADLALEYNLVTFRQLNRIRFGQPVWVNGYGQKDNEDLRLLIETEMKMRKANG